MDCKKVIEELKDLKKQSNLSNDDFINLKKAFNVSTNLDKFPQIQEEIDEDQELYTDEQMEHFIAHLNN